MWLIDTNNLELKNVDSPQDVKYAILSHTWEEEEVDFQEMRFHRDLAKGKKGFGKIAATCSRAQAEGIPYAWVDTCCIDKTSSAALSEAINSMFQWYRDSFICYAYLSDLSIDLLDSDKDEGNTMESGFSNCRWFTRGWTLQELIAPKALDFYDCKWRFLGTKANLREEVSSITGIDVDVLEDIQLLPNIPIARRMSWASKRKTTRAEFIANTSREGHMAFIRLQEEILRNVDDLSLFAWTVQTDGENGIDRPILPVTLTGGTGRAAQRLNKMCCYLSVNLVRATSGVVLIASPGSEQHYCIGIRGVLARSPSEFAGCGELKHITNPGRRTGEFSMTNRGLKIKTILGSDRGLSCSFLGLSCAWSTRDEGYEVAICLMKIETRYVRERAFEIYTTPREHGIKETPLSTIYIKKDVAEKEARDINNQRNAGLGFEFNLPKDYKACNILAYPRRSWKASSNTFRTHTRGLLIAYLESSLDVEGWRFLVVCGREADYNPLGRHKPGEIWTRICI
ncbi:HET-domain-containing protein [Hypoxylon sp. EC38]|nr:HET-domain-containing protein [Hypoxylon sp. EC38]